VKVIPFTIPVTQNQTILVQEDQESFFYPYLHKHPEIQITWVKEGEGALIAGNYLQPFSAGQVVLLGSNQPHLFRSSPEYFEPNSSLKIHAFGVFFDLNGQLKPLLELPELAGIKKFLERSEWGLKYPLSSSTEIAALIVALQLAEGSRRIAIFLDLLHLLASDPCSEVLASSGASSFNEAEGRRMATIYKFMLDHFDQDISLAEVAQLAHLTPQAFCRYFKHRTRKTFTQFLTEIRVNAACKKLIQYPDVAVAAIALDCGFNNIHHFNRTFKQLIGEAPRQYVKRYRGIGLSNDF
jgi:AraC-like DNA-binding protein